MIVGVVDALLREWCLLASRRRRRASYLPCPLPTRYVVPGTWEARRSFLAMTEQGTKLTSTFAPYTQYEVAIPFELAGDCLLEVRWAGGPLGR